MVGHIVGLGDRHGENILFDSTTGDCVHVDFSCLFDKGLQLEKPELVPFRLTQNMIDGLGITGYEGIFLRVCEITLSVLRTHRETLMSVLETFIHDPLVEWTKSHKSSGVEVQNPHAQRAINNIEASCKGWLLALERHPLCLLPWKARLVCRTKILGRCTYGGCLGFEESLLKLFDQEEWKRVSEVRRKKMRECIKSGDDATNFLIKRLVAEVAPLVMVGLLQRRSAGLLC
ncbi:hypothetical protein NC653_011831 [Populus alba x Populus x berolinensis]|uniref:PI3K/PI4K catalytic domain-containing protein n=1 Tax=Populus alba x Populus x berolinensis TaxID=444605 RepID=A0AAD6R4E2_9ROSI|nr:hypothetical protein NC653_011831 [Populus alba x Populus x berolinensis]